MPERQNIEYHRKMKNNLLERTYAKFDLVRKICANFDLVQKTNIKFTFEKYG